MRFCVLSFICVVLLHSFVVVQTQRPQRLYQTVLELSDAVKRISDKIPLLRNVETRCSRNVNRLDTTRNQLNNQAERCNTRHLQYGDTLQEIADNLEANAERDEYLVSIDNSTDADKMIMFVHPAVRQCIDSFSGRPIHPLSAKIVCLSHYLWHISPKEVSTMGDFDQILGLVNSNDMTHSPCGYRVRKEYRCLTLEERERYHHAVQKVYDTGLLAVLARVHSSAGRRVHRGPAFLPWHRAFISIYETALCRYDPSVALVYWDPTIDHAMSNPLLSTLWTVDFVGNGDGAVTTGPYASQVTEHGTLTRLVGRVSRLISKAEIDALMGRCTLQNISRPVRRSLELLHDFVHSYVGGDMGFVNTAAYDPIFYMLHAYIDYVWERFRRNQIQNCNVDPLTDYPPDEEITNEGHNLTDTMFGMPFLQLRDGLASFWTDNWYGYEDSPTCGGCCNSANLRCDTVQNVCIPHSRLPVDTPEHIEESIRSIMSELEHEADTLPIHALDPFPSGESDPRTHETAINDEITFNEEHGFS